MLLGHESRESRRAENGIQVDQLSSGNFRDQNGKGESAEAEGGVQARGFLSNSRTQGAHQEERLSTEKQKAADVAVRDILRGDSRDDLDGLTVRSATVQKCRGIKQGGGAEGGCSRGK